MWKLRVNSTQPDSTGNLINLNSFLTRNPFDLQSDWPDPNLTWSARFAMSNMALVIEMKLGSCLAFPMQ